MTQTAPPLPVQTLSYAGSIESPWPAVVRLIAFFSLALGCARFAELAELAWLVCGTGSLRFWAITSLGSSLISGIGGILCVIGSIGLLRWRRSAGLVIAACWVLIGTTTSDLLIRCVKFARYDLFQRLLFEWGPRLLSTAIWAVVSALLPLMILMLLRMAMRDPQYRATLEQ